MRKRITSLFLVLAFCLTLLPTSALAEEPDTLDGERIETSIGNDTEGDGDIDNNVEEQDTESSDHASFDLEAGDAASGDGEVRPKKMLLSRSRPMAKHAIIRPLMTPSLTKTKTVPSR